MRHIRDEIGAHIRKLPAAIPVLPDLALLLQHLLDTAEIDLARAS